MTTAKKPSPTVGTDRPKAPGGRRGVPSSGRRKGTPNKVTVEFRETVQRLLDDNRANVAKWLAQVADGIPEVRGEDGKVVTPGRPGNPEAALGRLAALAEFAAPKLSRAEVTGDGGGPLTVVVQKLG
jgi:hypothetical protein